MRSSEAERGRVTTTKEDGSSATKDDDDDIGDFDGSKMIDDDNSDEDLDEDDNEIFQSCCFASVWCFEQKESSHRAWILRRVYSDRESRGHNYSRFENPKRSDVDFVRRHEEDATVVDAVGAFNRKSSSKGKQKKLLAYHSHNFYEQRETLRDRIVRNEDEEVIALVSDAGAPVVSDPGQDLVDLVLEANGAAAERGRASSCRFRARAR